MGLKTQRVRSPRQESGVEDRELRVLARKVGLKTQRARGPRQESWKVGLKTQRARGPRQ